MSDAQDEIRMAPFQRVHTPLSERYMVTCTHCGYERQMFGTEREVREEAERAGWKTRQAALGKRELAYCPHCQVLLKI